LSRANLNENEASKKKKKIEKIKGKQSLRKGLGRRTFPAVGCRCRVESCWADLPGRFLGHRWAFFGLLELTPCPTTKHAG